MMTQLELQGFVTGLGIGLGVGVLLVNDERAENRCFSGGCFLHRLLCTGTGLIFLALGWDWIGLNGELILVKKTISLTEQSRVASNLHATCVKETILDSEDINLQTRNVI